MARSDIGDKTLIFLHLHKTAGTSLNLILERRFPAKAVFPGSLSAHLTRRTIRGLWGGNTMTRAMAELAGMSEADKRQIEYLHIHGDVPFGIHSTLPQSCVYTTMLRNPVDRIVSLYYFLRRRPDTPYHYYAEQVSLGEFVESDKGPPTGNNSQVRRIGGLAPDAPLSPQVLEMAKENLQKHFVVVGLAERFNESLLLLAREFGWKRQEMLYSRRQVGTNKPLREQVPQDVLALIEERNKFDMELYRYGRQLFEAAVRHQGDSFEEELEAFEGELLRFGARPRIAAYNWVYGSVTKVLPRIKGGLRRIGWLPSYH